MQCESALRELEQQTTSREVWKSDSELQKRLAVTVRKTKSNSDSNIFVRSIFLFDYYLFNSTNINGTNTFDNVSSSKSDPITTMHEYVWCGKSSDI